VRKSDALQEVDMLNKVLIVDDSDLIHKMYKMVLMRYRCAIIDAQNGQDALEKNPDVNLLLVDINMPEMNGLDFIRKVKEQRTYDHIPIVVVSTEGTEEDAMRAISLGARGYVKKPFQPSDLHTLIAVLYPLTGHGTACSAV
jgi:two-component system chemotaxis response regulator CheY